MIAIDGYTNIDRIGLGGLGDVYRATDVETGVTVAIKVLRDVSDESVAWHRTRREFAALEALAGHPHVIQLIELIELEQGPGLVHALNKAHHADQLESSSLNSTYLWGV